MVLNTSQVPQSLTLKSHSVKPAIADIAQMLESLHLCTPKKRVESKGASLTVLTPVKASKKEKKGLFLS